MCLFFTRRSPLMILMRANPFQGPLEGVAPEIETFLGPEMVVSEASAIWA
jgi:hypothetical protein